jgi:DNA repair exonuclease SbcCD ATPase subunit
VPLFSAKETVMVLLGILAGVFAAATILCMWRLTATAKDVSSAQKAEADARAEADEVRRDLRAAQKELEDKRREHSDLSAERADLKKKLYDAREDAKRKQGSQKGREDLAEKYEARLRDMNHEVEAAREESAAARRAKEEAEKVLAEVKALREKVAALEAAAKTRVPRERDRPRREEPARSATPTEPTEPAAQIEALASEVGALKKKLGERDHLLAATKRRLDNANRIYLVTKSQLDLARDKIAMQGLRFAELLAIHEGRPPPVSPYNPSAAEEAAAEAAAMREAQDESEPVIPEAPPMPEAAVPSAPKPA